MSRCMHRWRGVIAFVALLVLPGIVAAKDRAFLLKNAELVVTMDPTLGSGPLGLVPGADVLFDDTGIRAVGRGLSPRTPAGVAKTIDVSGKIVMPGFVDTHTHLWQSAIRGCLLDLELPGWLSCNGYARTQNVTYDEAYTLVRLSTLDAINSGVTTVTDWSHAFTNEFVEGNVDALVDSGMRFVYAYSVPVARYDHFRSLKARKIDPNPLASIHVAAGARLAAVSTLAQAVGLAKETHTYINTHFREHVSDLDQGQLEALQQSGALTEVSLLLAHAVHLSDGDIATLARPNVHLSHQPLSNMRLASGVIRFPALAAAGVSVGMGLDGGTNDTSDMFMNMRAAVGLQRATTLSAAAYPTPAAAVRVATLGGATALGMQSRIGSVTPGKEADLLVLDPHTINWGPSWDWIAQIVYSAAPANVEWVFVGGKALKARGELVYPRSMKKLVANAEAIAARLKMGITGTAKPY
ncbi:MAG: amidohydrolase family protein [bacterium]|nr:amidohydrolase family protein [bacterium]